MFLNRKKEYVLLVVLCAIFLVAGGFLFRIWEGYHEAAAGYQKLYKFIIKEPDEESGEEKDSEPKETDETDTKEWKI